MKKLLFAFALVVSTLLTGCGFGTIATGEIGLRTSFDGTLLEAIVPEGLYTTFVSHVDKYTIKEIPIDLENLTPKAKDNLSLRELDVTVFYRVRKEFIRNLAIKRTGMSAPLANTGVYAPQFVLVQSVARSEIADAVSKHDSLVIHQQRDVLEREVRASMQKNLEASDPGAFEVTRVVVRQVLTDASIEQAIRNVVAKGKELEAAQLQVEVSRQNALATQQTANTLTPAFLQHEYNQVLMKFAEKGGTVILDGSASSKQFNIRP